MIKVLYLCSTLKSCAPTTQLRYILKGLDRSRYEPFVLTLSPEPIDSEWSNIADLGVEIASLGLSRGAGLVVGAWHLRRVLNRIKPDLVHSSGFRPDVMVGRVIFGLPTVATVRNYSSHDYPMKFGRLLGYWMALKHRSALSGFRAVVPCSHALAGLYGNSKLKFHVIQDGIDTGYFCPPDQLIRNQIRSKWGIGPGERLFVAVGSLIPRKDPLTLIRGFLRSSSGTRDHLFLLGDGPLLAACKKEAAGNKGVRLLGHVGDVRPYLQGADYYVSASHSEGLPNAVMEAMACGLPVALSDIPSHREQVQPSPLAGELFPVGDDMGLEDCIQRLILGNCKARSGAAVALVNQYFSAKKMSQKYQALYAELLDNKYVE